MNKYTLIDDIVKEFGGDKKKELRMQLNGLIESEFDIIKKQNNLDEKTALETQKYNITADIMKLFSSDYDKCIRIIERLAVGKWYNILIIPDNLWNEFIKQVLVRHDLQLDSERDYQYFRIVENE